MNDCKNEIKIIAFFSTLNQILITIQSTTLLEKHILRYLISYLRLSKIKDQRVQTFKQNHWVFDHCMDILLF